MNEIACAGLRGDYVADYSTITGLLRVISWADPGATISWESLTSRPRPILSTSIASDGPGLLATALDLLREFAAAGSQVFTAPEITAIGATALDPDTYMRYVDRAYAGGHEKLGAWVEGWYRLGPLPGDDATNWEAQPGTRRPKPPRVVARLSPAATWGPAHANLWQKVTRAITLKTHAGAAARTTAEVQAVGEALQGDEWDMHAQRSNDKADGVYGLDPASISYPAKDMLDLAYIPYLPPFVFLGFQLAFAATAPARGPVTIMWPLHRRPLTITQLQQLTRQKLPLDAATGIRYLFTTKWVPNSHYQCYPSGRDVLAPVLYNSALQLETYR